MRTAHSGSLLLGGESGECSDVMWWKWRVVNWERMLTRRQVAFYSFLSDDCETYACLGACGPR